jgi:4'-phosphopantetheinyl transferase
MLMMAPASTSPGPLWRPVPGRLAVSPGEVHVWRASLDVGPVGLQRLGETLSADERARAQRFHFPHHRDRYIAAHGILRELLARYLGTEAGDFRFQLNDHGKPALGTGQETADMRFNLSHSQDIALFAFAWRCEVGVDVEYIRPAVGDKGLAERFFSTQEVAALRALPKDAQNEAFFNCWTRKEAYVKARGRGLSINLASFAVSLAPTQMTNVPIIGIDDSEAVRWSFRSLAAGTGYAAAIVAEGSAWTLSLWQWT